MADYFYIPLPHDLNFDVVKNLENLLKMAKTLISYDIRCFYSLPSFCFIITIFSPEGCKQLRTSYNYYLTRCCCPFAATGSCFISHSNARSSVRQANACDVTASDENILLITILVFGFIGDVCARYSDL